MRILTVILLSFFLAIGPSGGCGNPAVHWNYYFYSIEELDEHFPKFLKKNDLSIIYVDCSISEKFELVSYEHYFGIHPQYTKMEDENGYIGQYGPTNFKSKLKYTYNNIELEIYVTCNMKVNNVKLDDLIEIENENDKWQYRDSIGTNDNVLSISFFAVDSTDAELVRTEREKIIKEIKDDIFKCLKVVNRSDFYDDVLEN